MEFGFCYGTPKIVSQNTDLSQVSRVKLVKIVESKAFTCLKMCPNIIVVFWECSRTLNNYFQGCFFSLLESILQKPDFSSQNYTQSALNGKFEVSDVFLRVRKDPELLLLFFYWSVASTKSARAHVVVSLQKCQNQQLLLSL